MTRWITFDSIDNNRPYRSGAVDIEKLSSVYIIDTESPFEVMIVGEDLKHTYYIMTVTKRDAGRNDLYKFAEAVLTQLLTGVYEGETCTPFNGR